jgi:PAS domain S-box-containing protein
MPVPSHSPVTPAPPLSGEAHFRQLAEIIDAIFWVLEPGTLRTLYVSPAYERITGLSCASAYEDPPSWHRAVESSFRIDLLAMLQEIGNGHRGQIEIRIQRPDGTRRWVGVRGFPICDAAGRVVRLGGLAEDITERKAAVEKIASFTRMLDLAHDAIVVRNFETTRVEYWNRGAETLYGYRAEEAIGRPVSDLIPLDDPGWHAIHAHLLQAGEWRGEIQIPRHDGSRITVQARSTLVRDAIGRPKSVLNIATDITEQKRAEQQLLRAQRLESVGTLASGLAHDLTNILAPITLSIPLLGAELDPLAKKAVIDTVQTSARRGAGIVRQVLAFARGLEGEHATLSLRHLLFELSGILRETFPRTITVECDYPAELWPVTGDPTQLHQVLLNLAINARDAMPDGGTLKISAANFTVDDSFASMTPGASPGPFVRLQVEDSGMGIEPAVLDKIFDPFFTTKDPGLGSGLGLSSTLGIVKSHGGFITVESTIRRGTTFQVFLPATPEAGEPTAEAAPPPPVRGHGETILLVDDESALLVVLSALLREAGYEVIISTDGTDALAAYMEAREKIQLVITDATMPFLDGAAFVRALRQIDPEIKVIGISGLHDHPRVYELQKLRLSGFLAKPFDGHTLLSAVHGALHPEP